jgi:DNA-binding transcriptional LysR family regulator
MTDFGNNELRRLDLTVLLVFLGLIRLRKATAVAAELGLTQSGVSQALRRLRDVFGDELFLRRPHGMDPTAVALALESPVAAAVASLRMALGGTKPFEPTEARGVLRLSALDAEQCAVVPRLLANLRDTAPDMQLSVINLKRRDVPEALAAGQIDIALGFFPESGDLMIAEPLYEQGYVVVGKPEVVLQEAMTLARYVALDHVLVSPLGDMRGIVDDVLDGLGLVRRVVMNVPQFFAAFAAVAETGTICTLPERVALAHAAKMGLVHCAPPISLRRFTVTALRHRRNAADARLLWAMDMIRASLVAKARAVVSVLGPRFPEADSGI